MPLVNLTRRVKEFLRKADEPRMCFGEETGRLLSTLPSDLLMRRLKQGVQMLGLQSGLFYGSTLSANLQAIRRELEARAERQK